MPCTVPSFVPASTGFENHSAGMRKCCSAARDQSVECTSSNCEVLAIDTDAHSPAALGYLPFGVMTARRGWAPPDRVVNTREWPDLKKLLKP